LGKLGDNIWVRTIKFRCIVQNFWDAQPYLDISDIEVDLIASNELNEEVDI